MKTGNDLRTHLLHIWGMLILHVQWGGCKKLIIKGFRLQLYEQQFIQSYKCFILRTVKNNPILKGKFDWVQSTCLSVILTSFCFHLVHLWQQSYFSVHETREKNMRTENQIKMFFTRSKWLFILKIRYTLYFDCNTTALAIHITMPLLNKLSRPGQAV